MSYGGRASNRPEQESSQGHIRDRSSKDFYDTGRNRRRNGEGYHYHDDGFNRSKRHKSNGGGLLHDESHERRPLQSTNGAEIQMHRAAPRHQPQQRRQPQSDHHYRHPRSASHGRHDTLSRQDGVNNIVTNNQHQAQLAAPHPHRMTSYGHSYSHRYDRGNNHPQHHHYHPMNASPGRPSQPPYGQVQLRVQPPQFSKINNIPELIQTACSSLSAMSSSDTAAFWNSLAKQLGRNNQLNLSYQQMNSHINQLFQHTRRTLETFGMKDLTQTTYSMAKLVDFLCKSRDSSRKDSIASSLSNLLLNDDATTINKDVFLPLVNASLRKLDQFDARHISNFAYAYALIRFVPVLADGSDLFDHIAMQGIKMSAGFAPQGISNMVWAFATVGKRHDALFKAMGDQVVAQDHLNGFFPQALSNIAWAYATAGVNHPNLFEKMANNIVQLDHLGDFNFKPQELSNTVWAFATARVSHPQLFEKVANHIVRLHHLRDFKPQALANIVWAYARAEVNHPRLFERVANHIVRHDHLSESNPQNLANIVWAYARAEVNHPHLFDKVADHIVRHDHLIWAFATAGVSHSDLFEKVGNHIVQLDLGDFNAQNLSNTVWAYARAEVSHPMLFEKMASHIAGLDHLREFIPQAISNIVWAYATAQVSHPNLFQKMADHVAGLDHLEDFKRHELYSTLLAYATERVSHPKLFDKLVIHIAGLDHLGLNLELLSDSMFAHVAENVSHPEFLDKLDHLREFDTPNIGADEASLNDDSSHECSSSFPDCCPYYEDASWQNNEDDFPTMSSGTMVCDQSNAGSQHLESQTYGVIPHAPYETNRILTLHVSDLSGVTEAKVYEIFISFGIDTVFVMSPFVFILLLDRDKALSMDGYEYWHPATETSRRLQIRVAKNQQNIPSNLLRTCVWADTRLGKMPPMNVCGFNLCGACQRDNFCGGFDRCPFGVHMHPGSNILDRTPRDESLGGEASGVGGSSIMARSSNNRSTSVINPSTSQDRSTSVINPSSSQLVASSSSELVAQPFTTSNVPPQTTTELSAPVQARRLPVVLPSPAFFKRKPRVLSAAIDMLRLYLRRTQEIVNKRVGREVTSVMRELQNKIITATINYVMERYKMIQTQLDANGCFHLTQYDDLDDPKTTKVAYFISTDRCIERTKSGMSAGKDGADGRPIDQIPEGKNPNDYVGFFGKIDQDLLDFLVGRNPVLKQSIDLIRDLSPRCKTYAPPSTVHLLCQLEEATFSSVLPGDPGGLLMEGYLLVDSVTDMSVPSPYINEAVADKMADTEVIAPCLTWTRQSTSMSDQMSNGKLTSGKQISTETESMVNAMVNLNRTFMQESLVVRLTKGSLPNIQVNKYSNAVDCTSFDTMMAALAAEVESLLEAQDVSTPKTVKTMRETLYETLSQLYTKDQSFYALEMDKTGNLANLGAATAIKLEDMIAEAIQSAKSTLILLEHQHLLSLKTHKHSTFLKYFSDSRRIGTVFCDNERKDEAAHLYQLVDDDDDVLGLVMNSFFVMNAPGKSIDVRLKMSQCFLAVKAVLAQANLLGTDSLNKEEEHMRAFAMVLEGWVEPSKFGNNTGWDKAAIRLNSPDDYNHGSAIRNKGLQALINPLIDAVGVRGIHWEVFVTLAMNLGVENLEKLYALFGVKIDLNNTAQTMLELQRKQGNRNSRSLTTEHKKKISDAHKKMKMSKEVKKIRDARNSLYDRLLEQGLIKKERGVDWHKDKASWRLRVPKRFFGISPHAAYFDYLDDANEAMKQLTQELDRGLDGGVRLPDSLHYDIENESNKKVLKTAIENARQTSKKKNNGRGKKASDNIIKSRGDVD